MMLRKVFLVVFLFVGVASIAAAQSDAELSVDEFERGISAQNVQLLDVRTQGEFRKGYVEGAMHSDINGKEFKTQVSALDKSKPVFVYCLSGGRSKKAAAYLRKSGYEVYELQGGMMAWNGAKKPVVKLEASPEGMAIDTFRNKVGANGLVLVDFYARWCAPCKQMAPWLDELSKKYEGKMALMKIDIDDNRLLADELSVNALPTIHLYKDGKEVWTHVGSLTKAQIEQKLKENL